MFHNPLFVLWHVFYVNINPIMLNKNLRNEKYPNVGPLLFKYNNQYSTNNTQENMVEKGKVFNEILNDTIHVFLVE